MLDTSTASLSSPPPLSRRSSTTPSAPSSSRRSSSWRSSPCAPEVKLESSTCAIFVPPDRRIAASTTGTSTRARRSSSSRGSRLPVTTVSSTSVPARPLIRVVASSTVSPSIGLPSTAVIRSPGRIPARPAGEPSKTVSTRSPRLTASTDIPTPSNSPCVASWNSL
jgi:hypothetical protein